MSSYTAPLYYLRDTKSGLGVVLVEYSFWFDDRDGRRWEVIVPVGALINGASIPKPAQLAFGWDPFDPRWVKAAGIHDVLVGEHEPPLPIYLLGSDRQNPVFVSWSQAASIFNEALKVKQDQHDCPQFHRRAFVASVRFWGVISLRAMRRVYSGNQ